MKTLAFFVILFVGCSSCGGITPTPDPIPVDGYTCVQVCEHMESVGCPTETPSGIACEVWLCNAEDIPGMSEQWDCVMRQDTCDAIRLCQEY